MLYVGNLEGKAYVIHSVWGLRTVDYKTKEEGRLIIGQTIVTSLHIGKDIEEINSNSLLINKVKGLSFVLKPLEENR